MDSTEKHIQKYYADKSLSGRKVAAILTEGEQVYRRGIARYLPVFATAAVLIVGFLFLNRYLEWGRLNQQVLAEIAMNHSKQLNVEVATGRYDILQTELDRLDFALGPADPALQEAYTLIGGRYCTIQGGLAAQLKLRHKKKKCKCRGFRKLEP